MTAKILFIDIETSPEKVYTWGRWQQNVSPIQVLEQSQLLCFSYKWYGEKGKAKNVAMQDYDEGSVVAEAHELLDEADIVVAHNAWGFDVKMLNRFFIQYGLTPPSPYKIIDTLRVAKAEFKFPANSLKSLGQSLSLRQQKLSNDGFGLWTGCMADDPKAWKQMIKYNNMDVDSMIELYDRFKPWIRNHPNLAMYGEKPLLKPVCPKCASNKIQWRGYHSTQTQRYHSFQCNKCGGWGRERLNSTPEDIKANLTVNV